MVSARTAITAGGASLGLILAVNIIGSWEGKRNDPYRDIVGVWTVCYGETRVQMKYYTDKECTDMLTKAVKEYQDGVIKCVPNLADRPYQLAAATSLAYNIGTVKFCNSTIAKQFRAGDYKAACNNFWQYRLAGGQISKGLVNRRADETKLCLRGL